MPLDILRSKAQEYVEASLVDEAAARVMVQAIEAERGAGGIVNDALGASDNEGDPSSIDDHAKTAQSVA